jgi:ectoine hydroxylase-related dioxygenase (phytanoyl-CoA dioxygenase family)
MTAENVDSLDTPPQAQTGHPAVSGSIAAPDPRVAARGLIAIDVRVHVAGTPVIGDLTLKLSFGTDATPVFSKPAVLSDAETRFPLNINSHLLPNGRTAIAATLIADHATIVWRDTATLNIHNDGQLADRVRASLVAFGTPVVVDGPCDTTHYDFADTTLRPWFDRPDALDHVRRLAELESITPSEADALSGFVTNGYLIAENLVSDDLLDVISAELDDAVARGVEGYVYGSSQRIHNLHLVYPGVRRLWSHPGIMRLLDLIFESAPRPCQTLTYIFGSQQDAHQDSIHLTPFPAGYMCGVWVAIDDVRPGSGELEVYPGSHRLPRTTMHSAGCPKIANGDYSVMADTVVAEWRRLLENHHFERIVYRPKRGAVLIWHENLMHAGGVRLDPSLSRRSIVSHVFAEGAVAFYDSTGMAGVTVGLGDLGSLE